jgi:hypothetical protein
MCGGHSADGGADHPAHLLFLQGIYKQATAASACETSAVGNNRDATQSLWQGTAAATNPNRKAVARPSIAGRDSRVHSQIIVEVSTKLSATIMIVISSRVGIRSRD